MAAAACCPRSPAKSSRGDGNGDEKGDGKSLFSGLTDKVKETASDVKDAVTGGGGGGKGKKLKLTNIVETIDVGVPVQLAYNQWTQFADFPSFMKKVERVEQEADEKLEWKAQIFLSHRTWEASIIEQVPDERIVWRSKGAKGFIDGAVTFHEVTPDLTRIVLILEYHPKGLFEKTGNLWRAQGRRARLELKHFGRHVMTQSVLHPDEVEGWRGEIRDGKVVEPEEDEAQPEESEELEETDEDESRGRRAEDAEAEDDEAEDRRRRHRGNRRGRRRGKTRRGQKHRRRGAEVARARPRLPLRTRPRNGEAARARLPRRRRARDKEHGDDGDTTGGGRWRRQRRSQLE